MDKKRCPYCGEEILAIAIKCKHCQTALGKVALEPLARGATAREFRIVRTLGEGGMGEVYLARNEHTGQDVALKVVSAELVRDAAIKARFIEEARVMTRLRHRNIVQLHHFFEDAGRFFMALEYVSGRSLDDMLDERPLTVPETCNLARQILEGLAYVHTLDEPVVHRDIKPSNILVTPEGRAVIIDFGVAKALGRQRMTRTGAAVGTYEYMSPEQVQGKDVGPESDVYSMGIVLYKMLSGIVPFQQKSEGGFEVMKAHVESVPPSIESFREGVPDWLAGMIDCALAKKPEERFAHAGEMLAHLDRESSTASMQEESMAGKKEETPKDTPTPAQDSPSTPVPCSLLTPPVLIIAAIVLVASVIGLVVWPPTKEQLPDVVSHTSRASDDGEELAFLALLGPINKVDLQKWSQNEEGLKVIAEVMQDEDVPFHIKVDAIVILVENGWSNRIVDILSRYSDAVGLANAVSEKLMEMLNQGVEASQVARDGLFFILEWLDYEHLDTAQRALTNWAFAGVTKDRSREEIWDLIHNRLALNQVRDLGDYAVPYALIMIQKRVESESWGLLNWVEFVFSFYNPEDEDPENKKKALQYRRDALQALRRYHEELFKKMETDKEAFFDPNDVLIVEKFDMPETVDYLLELVDKAKQYEALIISEKMFETLVPERDYNAFSDRMAAAILQKIPEIRDHTGMARLMQAELVLEKSQIQGLKYVPLVVEQEGPDGEKKTSFKPYVSARDYHPGKFIFGVVKDFLEPLVDKQRESLLEETKGGGRAGTDELPVDSAFMTELDARLDMSVTPLVEDWLSSKLVLKRIFGLAGLKYLGTAKAKKLLEGLKADKTDLSAFLGKGVTIGTLAGNGVKGIEMSKELQQLKLDAIRDKLLSPTEVERLRQRMLADLAVTGEELEKSYREELKKRQAKYHEQKKKLTKLVASYQKAIRRLCLAQIKDYPSPDKRGELQRYIDNTAIACQKDAEERLTKKKLDFFGFTGEAYRSAVILGLMKKEIAREYVIRLKARAYLKAAVEQGVLSDRLQKDLKRVKKWDLKDRKLRDVVDKFVEIALGMARDDFEKSNGERGISPDDIKEYREYLELPEEYVMANILVLQGKLEWNEHEESTQKWIARSLVEDAARKAFAPDAYFIEDSELVDYVMENYDDLWYVLQDMTNMTPADLQSRWGMSDDSFIHYKKIATKADLIIKEVLEAAVKEERLTQEQADVVARSYPLKDVVAAAFVSGFEVVRKKHLEEEEKKAK